jgi:cell division protein FtsB
MSEPTLRELIKAALLCLSFPNRYDCGTRALATEDAALAAADALEARLRETEAERDALRARVADLEAQAESSRQSIYLTRPSRKPS